MSTVTKIVCDFCCADVQEAWFFAHDAFRFVYEGRLVDAAKGEAAACTTCKVFVESKNTLDLLSHCLAANPELERGVLFVARYQSRVLALLTGAVRHVKLGNSEEPKDRFWERPCPVCGQRVSFDRAEAKDRKIVKACPGCSAELTVGPIGHKPDAEVRR